MESSKAQEKEKSKKKKAQKNDKSKRANLTYEILKGVR